jgi:3,4-dihydroxy-2-butanone 4-phosphate synthase
MDSELERRRLRAADNQALFRSVNERIEEISTSAVFTSFVCECLTTDCIERIPMTIEEYEHVRAHPTYFAVQLGHHSVEIERVVDSNDRYMTVEKLGAGGERAESLDPRSGRGRVRGLGLRRSGAQRS